jgi:hypothetical protein
VLLKILQTDLDLASKIAACKLVVQAADIGDIAEELGDEVSNYPDIVAMFTEHKADFVGGVIEPQ